MELTRDEWQELIYRTLDEADDAVHELIISPGTWNDEDFDYAIDSLRRAREMVQKEREAKDDS